MASFLEKPVAIQRSDISYGAIELARLFDDVFSEGVVGANDLQVQQYSAGARMSVEVAAGSAYVDFDTPDKGKYRVYNSALNDSGTPGAPNDDWEATFTPADATNPRVDRVVLLVYDGNHDGTAKYKGVFKVLPGVATAGATLTNLTGAVAVPVNAILLANVLVAAAATTIPTANIDTTVRVRSTVGGGLASIAVVPTGGGFEWFGSTPPTGYLFRDGSAVSRTTYAALFAIIGTTYGVGDGSTTFNLPDDRGRVNVGMGTHADVSTLGANDGVAVANRRPKHRHTAHTHSTTSWGSVTTDVQQGRVPGAGGTALANGSSNPADGGSGNANDSLDAPAYLVANKVIKT